MYEEVDGSTIEGTVGSVDIMMWMLQAVNNEIAVVSECKTELDEEIEQMRMLTIKKMQILSTVTSSIKL